jgi:peptidoglycan/xylan/chitin deacetylase (PgdA/CDA1 family)
MINSLTKLKIHFVRSFYNPPELIKKFYNDFYWNTTNEKILLTFDDGPVPENTETILERLAKYKIKALFFCVGDNIRKYPQLTKLILSEGHIIGNHTFNHKILQSLSYQEKIFQIKSFNQLLENEFNYKVKYFRPPHGKFQITTNSLLKKLNLKNVMWSLLTFDYKNNIELVKFAVKNYIKKDSIIVLHDSIKSKMVIQDAIDFIVEKVNEKKFTFGEPAECLK